ncbi:hypothetical protein OS493_009798 [Desmophyllum pertusum]|uniref:Uncharacterized protein n=1 Tax=Desmophyllum pertusum TaxID=174260 RepID=A0A9X0CM20_9CNID|nr:hypothetical protein OS493_009798 [Desmophyllum pertusum]
MSLSTDSATNQARTVRVEKRGKNHVTQMTSGLDVAFDWLCAQRLRSDWSERDEPIIKLQTHWKTTLRDVFYGRAIQYFVNQHCTTYSVDFWLIFTRVRTSSKSLLR